MTCLSKLISADKKLANDRKRAEKTRRNEELIMDIFNTI
jgi:hypothetical protein